MKKIALLIVATSFAIYNVFGQCDNLTIQTPIGTNIKACNSGGYSPTEIALADSFSRTFAIQVFEGGTNDYNCHGYAWHVYNGGDKVWINNLFAEAGNVDNYWMDGSYIELNGQPSSTPYTKVFYGSNNYPNYNDDHSAVTTSDSTVFISKMGCGVRCSHLKSNSPYDNSDLRYFSMFGIKNYPEAVCYGNNATFTTSDYKNCTYNWTYDTNLLNYVSGQGTKSFVVAPKTSDSQGNAWVKLELTIGQPINITRSVTKNIRVGRMLPWISPLHDPNCYYCQVSYGQVGTTYMIAALTDNPSTYVYDYQWEVYGPGLEEGYADYGKQIYFSAPYGGTYIFKLKQNWTCGWSDFAEVERYFYGNYRLLFSPNPATGETTLTIESVLKETTIDETVEWELEVYTQAQLLKDRQTKLKSRSTTINIAGWLEGVYAVRVKYGKEVLQGKLVVKR